MAAIQKQISIWLAVLGVLLGVSAAAQAQGLNIALTVLVQVPVTIENNVYDYKTTTIRVTQKDVLERLAEYYSFPAGSILECNGDFQIIGPTGVVLHTVSSTYLNFVAYSSVMRGRNDNNPGGRVNVKYFTPADVDIHIGTMVFDLHGLSQSTYVVTPTGGTESYSYTLQGGGSLEANACTVTGKIKFKIPVL